MFTNNNLIAGSIGMCGLGLLKANRAFPGCFTLKQVSFYQPEQQGTFYDVIQPERNRIMLNVMDVQCKVHR